MAARLNTKLLLVVFIVAATVVTAIGGFFLFSKKSAEDLVAAGDDLVGDRLPAAAPPMVVLGGGGPLPPETDIVQDQARFAKGLYGRALDLEPRNRDALDKFARVMTAVVPTSPNEADDLLGEKLGILKHRAEFFSDVDEDAWETYLRTLFEVGLRMPTTRYWPAFVNETERFMARWGREPRYPYARLYRGLALTYPVAGAVQTRGDREFDEGVALLRDYLSDDPSSDLGHMGLVTALAYQLGLAQREGLETESRAAEADLAAAIDAAKLAVPDGPATWYAIVGAMGGRWNRTRSLEDSLALHSAATTLASADYSDATPRLVRAVGQSLDTLRSVPLQSPMQWPDSVPLLEEWVEENPLDIDVRLVLARVLKDRGAYDASDVQSQAILDVPPPPAGQLSVLRIPLRVEAMLTRLDCAIGRWERVPGDDEAARAEAAEAVAAVADAIAAEVDSPDTDRRARMARAKAAYAAGDFRVATPLFEELIREGGIEDGQTLLFSALCLEREQQYGAALARLERALEQLPRNPTIILYQARMQARMGDEEAALETSRLLAEIARESVERSPGNEAALARLNTAEGMVRELEERLGLAEPSGGQDPLVPRLLEASAALDDGRYEEARLVIEAILAEDADEFRAITLMVRLGLLTDDTELLRTYVERALALRPDNVAMLGMQARLDNEDDPIGMIVDFHRRTEPDEARRAVLIVGALRNERGQIRRALAGLGETEDARRAELEGYETRLGAAIADWLGRAAPLVAAADDAGLAANLAELRFVEALDRDDEALAARIVEEARAEDYDRAQGRFFAGRLAEYRGQRETDPVERRRLDAEAVEAFRAVTERLPFASEPWAALGGALRRLGEADEAVSAYARAYENDPSDRAVLRAYAGALEAVGNLGLATAVARRGTELAPNDETARELWLRLESVGGDLGAVLVERRRLAEADPEDAGNIASLAALLGRRQPTRASIVDEEGSPRFAAAVWSRLSTREQRDLIAAERDAWRAEAERLAESVRPDEARLGTLQALPWGLLVAELAWARGDQETGPRTLRELADGMTTPGDRVAALVLLGSHLEKVERLADARAAYQEAAAVEGASPVDGLVREAALLESAGAYEQASEVAERTLEALGGRPAVIWQVDARRLQLRRGPVDPGVVERQLIQGLLRSGRLAEARDRYDARRHPDPASYDERLLEASILAREADARLAEGDETGALTIEQRIDRVLERARTLRPRDPRATLIAVDRLIRRYDRTFDDNLLVQALDLVNRAEGAGAGGTTVGLARVRILAAQRDVDGEINQLQSMVDAAPDDDETRRMLVERLVGTGQLEGAIRVVRTAIAHYGQRTDANRWAFQLGELLERDGQPVEAASAYLDAWERTGRTQAALLVGWARALLSVEPPAAQQVVGLLRDREADLEQRPSLRALYARALALSGRAPASREQLTQAYATISDAVSRRLMSPDAIAQFVAQIVDVTGERAIGDAETFFRSIAGEMGPWELSALAVAWANLGDEGRSRAIELQREAADLAAAAGQDGVEGLMRFRLGGFLLGSQQYEGAAAAFERALEIDPENPLALNNAAFVLAKHLGEAERARPMSVKAAAIRPDDWAVLDTAGVVHGLVGDDDAAERYLRRSIRVRAMPENLVHLAEVRVRAGAYDEALGLLEDAAELNDSGTTRDAEVAAQIDALATDIQARKRRGE